MLSSTVSALRDRALSASVAARADAIREALRTADELIAVAVESLSCGTDDGLPADLILTMDARRTSMEARSLAGIAARLRGMPVLADAFATGLVSFSQVRAIVSAVAHLPAAGRDQIDALIRDRAPSLADADPDLLVGLVEDDVARFRADLALAREDRAIRSSFLSIQGRLDGGSRLYGEADPEATAIICEALDAAADRPRNPDTGAPTRAQQRMEALVAICERRPAADAGTRPLPRLLATVDLTALDGDAGPAMQIFQRVMGGPARMTSVAARTLLCDASIVPILTVNGRPIAVGDAATPVTGKLRAALIARDGGCRFPGCSMPPQWTDAHHLVPGRGRTIDDVALHCRRHHRTVHRNGWNIVLHSDASMTYTLRGRTYRSLPRHRAPPA